MMTRRKLLGTGIAGILLAGITAYAVLQGRKPPSYEGKRAR